MYYSFFFFIGVVSFNILYFQFVEYREVRYIYSLEFFCYCFFYEEVMYLVEEGKIYLRVFRYYFSFVYVYEKY